MGISRHFAPGFSERRRGQVDAPIELFVAVIVLAMSLSLAFYVYNSVQNAQCIAELHTQTQALQTAMQQVSIGSAGTTRTARFTLSACASRKVVGLRFARYEDPVFCRQCLSRYGGCWKIEPLEVQSGRLTPIFDATSCVEMSGKVDLYDESVGPTGRSCSRIENGACPPEGSSSYTGRCDSTTLDVELGCDPNRPNAVATLCRTLGDKYRTYTIRLKKDIQVGTVQGVSGEVPKINICAQPPEGAAP